jgi:hypothetical protein
LTQFRKKVETANSLLDDLGVNDAGAQSLWGLKARIVAKLALYSLAFFVNTLWGNQKLKLAGFFF